MFAIETAGLTRRFGKLTAVDHLDLHVPRATVYGFLGPNGAGKTTTIRLLLKLIRPDQGEIRIHANGIGALVEMPSLYPHLTGRENLEVTRRLLGTSKIGAERALAIVRLEKDGNRQVKEYSLGMRQRLGLALALLSDPELLILDEPTNGLDPAGIHEIRTLIQTLAREHGITVLMSSHLLSEVEQTATHIGIVSGGRMLFQGTLAELHAHQRPTVCVGVDRPAEALRLLENASVNAEGMLELSGDCDAAHVNSLLVRSGFHVHHLTTRQLSLEEIFLALTAEDVAQMSSRASVEGSGRDGSRGTTHPPDPSTPLGMTRRDDDGAAA
jgi:lantibiotic transport system ATP-binding protein